MLCSVRNLQNPTQVVWYQWWAAVARCDGGLHLAAAKLATPSHHLLTGHFVDSLKEMGLAQDMIDEAAGVLIGVRPLFDPERYKGKIDVEKIEKSASGPQTPKAAEGQETPPCCSMM